MFKAFLPAAIVAALSLSACSHKAQNELGEASNTISADANATMAEATRDTDAAANAAFGVAENGMDSADNAAKSAKNKAGAALKDMGNEVQD